MRQPFSTKLSQLYQRLPVNLSTLTGYRYPGVPCLTGHPLLGRVQHIAKHNGMLNNVLEACELAEQQDTQLSYYWMLGKPVVVSINPYHIDPLTEREGPFSRDKPFAFFQEIGPIIFTDDYLTWQKKRQVYNQHLYHTDALLRHEKNINTLVQRKLASAANQSTPLELHQFCGHFAFELMLKTIFGISDERYEDTRHSFEPFVEQTIEAVFDLENISKWMTPTPIRKLMYRGKITDPKAAYQRNKAALKATLLDNNPDILTNPQGFLHALAQASPTGITGDAIALFFAGKDSTASSMPLVIKLLEQHPNVKQALRAEIKTKLGDVPPTAHNIRTLTYLSNVIKEALRLYPPFPFMTRGVDKRCEFDGLLLHPNDTVILATYHIQRTKAIWGEDAAYFKPERFENLTKDQRKAFQPFGHGYQFCIGKKFVELELTLMLATLYGPHYDIEIKGANTFNMTLGSTLKPTERTQFLVRHHQKAEKAIKKYKENCPIE